MHQCSTASISASVFASAPLTRLFHTTAFESYSGAEKEV